MKHLTLLLLFALAFGCSEDASTVTDPLSAARDKLLSASSVSFEMDNIWYNTFLNDTMIEHHTALYLASEQEPFPYDFAYLMEDYASIYDKGKMTDVNSKKRQIITYTEEEAIEDVSYEGSYATQGSPFGIVKDTSWTLAGQEGKMVIYELEAYKDSTEDGRSYTIERIHIDEERQVLVAWERIYTLNEKPMQHIIHEFSDYRFNQDDALNFSFPEGFSTVNNADLEKMREADALTTGQSFPEFSLRDIDGKPFDSDNLNGRKGLYIFSFIGCGGCEYTRRELARMNFELNDEYVGLYLNPLNTADQLRDYHADKPWPFPMATINYDFSERYGVYSYPTFITVDENGMVEEIVSGYEEAFFLDKAK